MNHYTFELTTQHRPEVFRTRITCYSFTWLYRDQYGYGIGRHPVQLKITVKSDRTFDLLVNQLAKLPDVLEIK